MSYLIRRVLAKPRLILDEMCRLYGKFASYLRRVLCKTRLIFPRINGPIVVTTRNNVATLCFAKIVLCNITFTQCKVILEIFASELESCAF